MATGFADGVRIWAGEQSSRPFILPAGPCNSAIFSADGTSLITCGPSGLALWPMHRIPGTTTNELHIGPRQAIRDGIPFNYAALSADGRWAAAANPNSEAVSIYEVGNPSNGFSLVSQPGAQCPAISPDGRWVAVGNWKGSGVKVWDFASQQVVCSLPTPASAWVRFSPDNRWLAVGGASCDLWETGSWKLQHTIRRPRFESPTPLAFSPDCRTLAIGVEAGTVKLLVVPSGEVVANLEAPGLSVISYLHFSPDGSRLLASEWEQQVQVWDLRRMRAELRKLNLDFGMRRQFRINRQRPYLRSRYISFWRRAPDMASASNVGTGADNAATQELYGRPGFGNTDRELLALRLANTYWLRRFGPEQFFSY